VVALQATRDLWVTIPGCSMFRLCCLSPPAASLSVMSVLRTRMRAGGSSFRAFAFCERVGSKCSIPHTRGFVTIFELTGAGFRNGNRGILESHPCGEAEKAKASFTPRACPERSLGDGPPSSVVREEKTKVPRLRKAGPPARQPRPAGKTAWQPGLHRLRHRDFRPAREFLVREI
jgi:hypothetical protein